MINFSLIGNNNFIINVICRKAVLPLKSTLIAYKSPSVVTDVLLKFFSENNFTSLPSICHPNSIGNFSSDNLIIANLDLSSFPLKKYHSPIWAINCYNIPTYLDCNIISCGYGSKDTITVGSLEENQIMLSLQRPISSLIGKEVSPSEFLLYNKANISTDSLLTIGGIIICSGLARDTIIISP